VAPCGRRVVLEVELDSLDSWTTTPNPSAVAEVENGREDGLGFFSNRWWKDVDT